MIIPFHVRRMLATLRATLTEDMARRRLSPTPARMPALRGVRSATEQSVRAIWHRLKKDGSASDDDEDIIADPQSVAAAAAYSRNIENFIGTVKVPLGVIGPLRINGIHANGEFFVPLATSEAALVASYGRGADVVSSAGGASAAMVSEGVLRTPGFVFRDLMEAGLFIDWVASNDDALRAAAEATTRHGKLVSIEPVIDNDTVFLLCRYTTGDASGQNMVTIATQAACLYIEANTPIKPRHWFLEANFSGDKKASFLGLLTGRGRKVTASVIIPDELIERRLHTSVERILEYAKIANLGALLSGQLGAQAHYANGLAAFYIATGQDAACVAESATGYTRVDRRDGGVFVSVTLPNILVGSVGGGTSLPSQAASLGILGLRGPGKAAALAEVAAVLCLCGEVSIIGAMAAGQFARAHHKLARQR
ncbi:hydroxymethylglutaryl-CoA reductase [Dongia deserti]|uniref:hydroxymethylglutaryl-CoA reductase n=1 Tax=Dongia deserti TaxID=2268030 RepID=UPI0025488451|nr:hydroxymethylglutaryl-CoA reductase [Dongia deserti]